MTNSFHRNICSIDKTLLIKAYNDSLLKYLGNLTKKKAFRQFSEWMNGNFKWKFCNLTNEYTKISFFSKSVFTPSIVRKRTPIDLHQWPISDIFPFLIFFVTFRSSLWTQKSILQMWAIKSVRVCLINCGSTTMVVVEIFLFRFYHCQRYRIMDIKLHKCGDNTDVVVFFFCYSSVCYTLSFKFF